MAGIGTAGSGRAGQTRLGQARHGKAGKARLGLAGRDVAGKEMTMDDKREGCWQTFWVPSLLGAALVAAGGILGASGVWLALWLVGSCSL